MTNENISSSVDVFVSFASMFVTRIVAFRFIISISIPDLKMTKVGRLFGRVFWRLSINTSNLSIIFQNVVIRFNALNEMINIRTEFSDNANIFVLPFGGVGK